jgi:hypothetical protein
MSKLGKSPDQFTFQKETCIKHQLELGKTPEEDYLDVLDNMPVQRDNRERDAEWQKNNLEYDLRSTPWVCDKVKNSDVYAQHLYSALCNQNWQKQEVWTVLKGETWSCSWRHSGGIIADMLEEGDYIDWYCSGIGNSDDGYGLDHRQATGYVPEGTVTEEIRADLLQLGWVPVDDPDSDGVL